MTSSSNANYAIDDGYGNTLAAGLPSHLARKRAQECANERGESVYLYQPAGEADSEEEITPEIAETADVTDAQIRALREEAVAAGDHFQADLCQRALSTDTIDQDGNPIALADWTQEDARAACVESISCANTTR